METQAFHWRHFHWRPQSFHLKPQTFRFKPQIFFEDRPQIFVREKMKIGGCLGSPMKIWDSRWKVWSRRGKSWGLRLKSWVVQWKFRGLQRKSEDLHRKFGVSDAPMKIRGSLKSGALRWKSDRTPMRWSWGSPIVLKWWWFLPLTATINTNFLNRSENLRG